MAKKKQIIGGPLEINGRVLSYLEPFVQAILYF